MSRSLGDLHSAFRPFVDNWLAACDAAGLDILVTCTHRSLDEQQRLYEQGRTMPGKVVTNAKPGQSAHNFALAGGKPASLALDFVPLVNGKPVWDGKHPHWTRAGELAESCGMEWAGRWKRFKELPHIQHRAWKSIKSEVIP